MTQTIRQRQALKARAYRPVTIYVWQIVLISLALWAAVIGLYIWLF